jgi:hypothetical protein
MLAEWKKEYSRAYKKYAETAKFERLKYRRLWQIVFFYPFGITNDGIHNIARVFLMMEIYPLSYHMH